MSGLNVEALLDSVAPSKEAQGTAEREDRHKQDRSDRRDRDRARDGSRDRERDRKRRDRSRDRKRDGNKDKDRERDKDKDTKDKDEEHVKSPRSERVGKGGSGGGSRRHSRERRRDKRRTSDEGDDRHGSGSGAGAAGDFYRGGGRSRSGSPDGGDRHYRPSAGRGGHRDRDHREDEGGRGDRDRERERDRPRERERDRERDRDRQRRRPRSNSRGKSRSKSPTLNEDERDRRTVFVQQLAARLRSKELIAFFEKVGPVKEAQIVKDRVSGRSKGVGYVEFKNEESVPLAIQLTGQRLLGIPIIAQLTEAEKNRQARNNEGTQGTNGIPFHRLYVGNIHFSITESDLQNVFEPFGELEFVQLQKEEGGRSRGYGFVQFRDPTAAKEALEKMNGFDLAGRPIRVGLGNDKFTSETTANLLQRFPGPGQPGFQGSDFSGSGGRGTHAGGANNFDRAGSRDDKGASGASALDDSDVAGVNFSNYSRDSLMRKLARTDEPAETNGSNNDRRPMGKPRTETKPLPVNVPQASRCVVLRNMFDATEQEGDEWIKELEVDVKAECEEKYGHVVHIALDPNSHGDIYVKFDRVTGGENAIRGLNGRFFDGRQISAQPVVDAVYSSLFTRSRAM